MPLFIPVAIGAYELAVIGGGLLGALFLASPQGQEAVGEAVDAAGDLVGGAVEGAGNLIGSVASSQAQSDSQAQSGAPAVPVPGAQTQTCSPCPPLLAAIDRLINSTRPVDAGQSGLKGLKQRFCAQKYGRIGPTDPRWVGEVTAIRSQQNGLRHAYYKAVKCGCPIPPELHSEVGYYVSAMPPRIGHRAGFEQYCFAMAAARKEG